MIWTIISKVGSDIYVEKHSLFQSCRSYISVADINFHTDSSFIVATSDGTSTSPINVFKIQISSQNMTYSVSITSSLGIVLNENHSDISVTHLKFPCKFSSSDELIVVTEHNQRSKVKFWRVDKEIVNFHSAIINTLHSSIQSKLEENCWLLLSEFTCNSKVASLAVPQRLEIFLSLNKCYCIINGLTDILIRRN